MSNLLPAEEYIEQSHFFGTYLQRLQESHPTQEILFLLKEELLATTRLPMAVEFLTGELLHHGKMGQGMRSLSHYFTAFQAFVMEQSEVDNSKFDQHTALLILQREAEYRATKHPQPAALFMFQFECISRNRLGYDHALQAIAEDPLYPEVWKTWIQKIRFQLGTIDFSDLVYAQSQYAITKANAVDDAISGRNSPKENAKKDRAEKNVLFGTQEGRIALANRGKDPLFLFTALQRHLGYPEVPRPKKKQEQALSRALEARLQQLESRVKFLEAEGKGNLDLSQFYAKPPQFDDDSTIDLNALPPSEP